MMFALADRSVMVVPWRCKKNFEGAVLLDTDTSFDDAMAVVHHNSWNWSIDWQVVATMDGLLADVPSYQDLAHLSCQD